MKTLKLFLAVILLSGSFCYSQISTVPQTKEDSIANALAIAAAGKAKASAVKKDSVIKTMGVERFYNKSVNGCTPSKIDPSENCICPDEYVIVRTNQAGLDLAMKNKDTFRLWMNGVCFDKMKPMSVNYTNSYLIFKLAYDTARTSPWELFYAYPNYWSFNHDVILNLGTLQKEFPKPACENIKLYTSSKWMLVTGYSLFVVLLVLLYWLGKGLLKDLSPYTKNGITVTFDRKEPTNEAAGTVNIKSVPYSMARV